MAKHVTLATAIDKSRLHSDTVYLLLLEVDVIDAATGAIKTTVCIANNNEPFTYNGKVYLNVPFEFEITNDKETTPTATLTVTDFTQTILAALTSDGWGLDWPARFKVVNATNPSETPELEQDFRLLDATAGSDQYSVSFTVGAENPLALRFPPRQQFRERCAWGYMGGYRGPRCKYAGPLNTCDYTFSGTNGCVAHENTINYGGFPGVQHSMT